MKSILLLILLFITSVNLVQAQKSIVTSPEKPKPGQVVKVKYIPTIPELKLAQALKMFVHLYGKTVDETYEQELTKEVDGWTSEFKTSDTTKGVILRFSDLDEENKDKEVCPVLMYGADNNPVPMAKAGLGRAYISWIQVLDIESDAEKALKSFNEEFTVSPSLKKDFFMDYFRAYSKVDKDKAAEMVKAELPALEKSLTQSEDDLIFLSNLYRINKEMDKAEKTQALILEKYPKGKMAEQSKFGEYYNAKDPVKKGELAKKFIEDFPNSQFLPTLKMNDINELVRVGKYEEAYNKIKNDASVSSSLYNSIAWAMYEKDINLALAKEIAEKGVELSKKEIEKSTSKKPAYYSQNTWDEKRKSSRYAIIDTYGAILLKLGENENALKPMEEAYMLDKGRSVDVTERYAQALNANKMYEKSKGILEKCFDEGKNTAGMKDLLKEVYLKLGKSETDINNAIENYSKNAAEKRAKELAKEMIDIPAPKFTLEDLDGNKVSLADLAGNVVIIDFWATWCGPCKASFPGMQKAVNKFANNPNIQFLFVNSWERAEDKKKNASDFIKENKYSFKVLMDSDDKVITNFKVDGVPTKFIIDKNGNIRFKSVGFSGSDDKLVDEISAMIGMLL